MSRYNATPLIGAAQAQALLGNWFEIVGNSQESGVPTTLNHGMYGGHPHRHRHGHGGGLRGGYGPQADYGQPPGYGGGGGYGGNPYGIPARNHLIEYPQAHRADRIILPMSSGVNILPNTSAQITSRPQNVAFRPERLIIGGTPANWIVNDCKVGNRSQFSQSGDIPGELFSATAVDVFVSMETVQTAMDFVLLVTFVGASESGEPFVCGVLGTAAV